MDNTTPSTVSQPGTDASAVGFDWTDQLALNDPLFDATHREFVDLIQALHRADDAHMLDVVNTTIGHTEAHFRQETTLMQLHGFPPIHCHDGEHANVMEVMLAVRDRVAAGEVHYGRVLAAALMEWLHVHVPTMDAVLSAWLRERGLEESPPAAGIPDVPRVQAG